MRAHYFDRDAPDADDVELADAIAQGRVPEGCLRGGPYVKAILTFGLDPCADCEGPRERCDGRPKTDATARDPEDAGAMTSLKLRRAEHIRTLLSLLPGETPGTAE